MPYSEISSGAFDELNALAKWLESAEMKKDTSPDIPSPDSSQSENLLRCVDKDRVQKTRPLLKALGYAKPVIIRSLYMQ